MSLRWLYRAQRFLRGCYGSSRVVGITTLGSYRVFKQDDPYAIGCIHDVSLREPCAACLDLRSQFRSLP